MGFVNASYIYKAGKRLSQIIIALSEQLEIEKNERYRLECYCVVKDGKLGVEEIVFDKCIRPDKLCQPTR